VTPQAYCFFILVQKAMKDIFLKQYDPKLALWGVIFPTPRLSTGVLWQPHNGILEWVHLQISRPQKCTLVSTLMAEAVTKTHRAAIQAVGQEPDQPVIPCPKETLSKMLEFSTEVQVALGEYPGTITHQLPNGPSLQALAFLPLHLPSVVVSQPIPQAMLVFTDANAQGRIGIVAYAPNSNKPQTQVHILGRVTPQLLELTALEMVLKQFPKPVNVLTDSVYCAQILPKLPGAYLKVDLTRALDRNLGSIQTLLEH
jgi:hypothetical protein